MASRVRGEDTSGCWEVWGCWLPLEPHPEAGISESCLPGLATGGAVRGGMGGCPSEPMASGTGRATQLGPEQMNRVGWEVGGQEARPPPAPRKALAAGVAWCGMAGRRDLADEEGKGTQQGGITPPHANMVSCNHLNRSKVTTPSRSVSRVLKNRNMVSSRTRQHTKLSKSTARSGSE